MLSRRLLGLARVGRTLPAMQPSYSRKSIRSPILTRSFAQQPPAVESMDTHTYHRLSDKVFDSLVETLESLIEEGGFAVADSSEVEFNSGVLTLSLDKHGTYVINKQPPTRQIWVSSPISGPRRYEYDSAQNTWLDVRDGSSLNGLLDGELSPIVEKDLNIGEGWMDQ